MVAGVVFWWGVQDRKDDLNLQSVCVFCGSSPGNDGAYLEAARELGNAIAKRGLTLVYGGGDVGLMGELASAATHERGKVIGVIPRFLSAKVGHVSGSEVYEVDTMHERKAKMYGLSDACIAMPGGLGTLEEISEAVNWVQLGLHDKPVGLLNVRDYFGNLIRFFDHAVSQRFLRVEHRDMLVIDDDPGELLNRMIGFRSPHVEKWLDR